MQPPFRPSGHPVEVSHRGSGRRHAAGVLGLQSGHMVQILSAAGTNSMTLTLQRESFASSRMATRSTQPEVFTFELVPAQITPVRSYVPIRPKKRCTRVMYPAKVHMHLPKPEKSRAKRWLVILCLVVLWQIYTEAPYADAPVPVPSADSPVSDSRAFSLQSAEEEQAGHLSDAMHGSELQSGSETSSEGEQIIPNTTCASAGEESETSRSLKQSAERSYVVALLVYHRLGNDN